MSSYNLSDLDVGEENDFETTERGTEREMPSSAPALCNSDEPASRAQPSDQGHGLLAQLRQREMEQKALAKATYEIYLDVGRLQ